MDENKDNNNIVEEPVVEKKTMGFASHPENINRNGRPPREWTWAKIVEEEVEKLGTGRLGSRKEKLKQTMVKRMIGKVLKGDVTAMKVLMDRTDGLPKQVIEGDINLYKLNIVRAADGDNDNGVENDQENKLSE